MVNSKVTMTTVSGCSYKEKTAVLSPTRVVPGDGDFEVPELPKIQWPVPKGENGLRNSDVCVSGKKSI